MLKEQRCAAVPTHTFVERMSTSFYQQAGRLRKEINSEHKQWIWRRQYTVWDWPFEHHDRAHILAL